MLACSICQIRVADSVCLSCKDKVKASILFALKTAFCSTKYCTWNSNTNHPISVPAFDLRRTLPALWSYRDELWAAPFVPSTCIPAGSWLSTYRAVCWAALSSNPAGNWSLKSTSLFHDHWELNQFCWLSLSFLPRLVPLQMTISQVQCIESRSDIETNSFLFQVSLIIV